MNGSRDAALPLGIVVVGASGDLAQRKIIPALFALYCQGLLPEPFNVFGLARTPFSHEAFRERIAQNLTCRYAPGESCADRTAEFLSRCFYTTGQYGEADAFLDLYQTMREVEGPGLINRLFYMAIPPAVFLDVARALGDAGLVACGSSEEWSRLVVEKPFGRDRASSDQLVGEMQKVFTENQTYRIDHYLGKEIVQNLMVLRFANRVFEPVWNRDHIESVRITWKEPVGVGQRGGYFDGYGIIRDVMQNHLLQILALLAMERPAHFDAHEVRNAKVRLLRAIPAVRPDDLVVGQYAATNGKPAYTQEPTVPPGSLTPTFAAVSLRVDNDRWRGVPFYVEAGKALDTRVNEVTIRFRRPPEGFFDAALGALASNELAIRIQPDEAIEMRIMNKVPGLRMAVQSTPLNLTYRSAFNGAEIPDAYECLLLDVIRGDRSLFIRADELEAAWDVFTPALHALEATRVVPEPYAFGSRGPAAAERLAAGLL